MSLAQLKPETIEPSEIPLLIRFAPAAVGIGALLGFLISIGLWDEETIYSSFWTESLKIVGVASLPLIALAVRLERLRTADFQKTALLYMAGGVLFAAAVIMMCLHQVAIGGKDGIEAADWQVSVAYVGIGVTIGALAVAVAAEVLDKIDG